MKRGFQKSLALLLAVFMAFGAVPFVSAGLVAFATDPELVSITLSVAEEITMVAGETKTLSIVATYANPTSSKFIDASEIAWSSTDSKLVEISSSGVLKAVAQTEEGKPVTVKAFYIEGEKTVHAECKVTVTKAPVYVDRIDWSWDQTSLLADTGEEFSFAYDEAKPANNLYKIIPDNADVKSATLTCTPATALQIDNVKKTFKVNAITQDQLPIVLTLTADGAGEKCQSVTKALTIYKDVPITGVKWTFTKNTTNNKSLFSYMEKKDGVVTQNIGVYYYKPAEKGNDKAPYKYETIPASKDYLELCKAEVSSSDKRVIIFDEETGRIIPVGNGEATLTVTLTTPKGKVYKDSSVIAVVQNSPYTPVTSVAIGYDKDKTDSDAEYDSASNTLKLMYTHSIQLTANLNTGAKLDQKAIEVELDDGRKIKTVSPITHTWKSSDTSVAEVDKDGKVTVTGSGTATITLTVDDNGVKKTKEVNIKGTMSWWEALVGILMSLFSGRWDKIPGYFKALFGGLV